MSVNHFGNSLSLKFHWY